MEYENIADHSDFVFSFNSVSKYENHDTHGWFETLLTGFSFRTPSCHQYFKRPLYIMIFICNWLMQKTKIIENILLGYSNESY